MHNLPRRMDGELQMAYFLGFILPLRPNHVHLEAATMAAGVHDRDLEFYRAFQRISLPTFERIFDIIENARDVLFEDAGFSFMGDYRESNSNRELHKLQC